jgi:hypothetical protein
MNKIVINSVVVIERTGSKPQVNDKGFALPPKPWKIRIQTGHIYCVDKEGVCDEFPGKFEILLDDEQAAYPKGVYTFSPSAVYLDRNGRLAITPRLIAYPSGKAA